MNMFQHIAKTATHRSRHGLVRRILCGSGARRTVLGTDNDESRYVPAAHCGKAGPPRIKPPHKKGNDPLWRPTLGLHPTKRIS